MSEDRTLSTYSTRHPQQTEIHLSHPRNCTPSSNSRAHFAQMDRVPPRTSSLHSSGGGDRSSGYSGFSVESEIEIRSAIGHFSDNQVQRAQHHNQHLHTVDLSSPVFNDYKQGDVIGLRKTDYISPSGMSARTSWGSSEDDETWAQEGIAVDAVFGASIQKARRAMRVSQTTGATPTLTPSGSTPRETSFHSSPSSTQLQTPRFDAPSSASNHLPESPSLRRLLHWSSSNKNSPTVKQGLGFTDYFSGAEMGSVSNSKPTEWLQRTKSAFSTPQSLRRTSKSEEVQSLPNSPYSARGGMMTQSFLELSNPSTINDLRRFRQAASELHRDARGDSPPQMPQQVVIVIDKEEPEETLVTSAKEDGRKIRRKAVPTPLILEQKNDVFSPSVAAAKVPQQHRLSVALPPAVSQQISFTPNPTPKSRPATRPIIAGPSKSQLKKAQQSNGRFYQNNFATQSVIEFSNRLATLPARFPGRFGRKRPDSEAFTASSSAMSRTSSAESFTSARTSFSEATTHSSFSATVPESEKVSRSGGTFVASRSAPPPPQTTLISTWSPSSSSASDRSDVSPSRVISSASSVSEEPPMPITPRTPAIEKPLFFDEVESGLKKLGMGLGEKVRGSMLNLSMTLHGDGESKTKAKEVKGHKRGFSFTKAFSKKGVA